MKFVVEITDDEAKNLKEKLGSLEGRIFSVPMHEEEDDFRFEVLAEIGLPLGEVRAMLEDIKEWAKYSDAFSEREEELLEALYSFFSSLD